MSWYSWIREVLMGPNGRVKETDQRAAPFVEGSKRVWDETRVAYVKASEDIQSLCKPNPPAEQAHKA